MPPLLAASLATGQIWYVLPLLVAVSLVYGATRHEVPSAILQHALSTAMWMVIFLGIVFAILFLLALWV
jgi:hypothetical protein